MEETFFIFAGWVVAVLISVTACQDMSRKRGREPEGWILLSAFIGPLAVALLYWLGPAKPLTKEQRALQAQVSTLVGMALLLGLVSLMLIPALRACYRF